MKYERDANEKKTQNTSARRIAIKNQPGPSHELCFPCFHVFFFFLSTKIDVQLA